MKALVVFHGHGNHWASRFLKPDFRHVFVAFANDPYWIRVDGMSGIPVAEVVGGTSHDLAGFYRNQGFHVIETEQATGISGPFLIANCVGMTKAILGLNAPFCWTPYQLYKRLKGAT